MNLFKIIKEKIKSAIYRKTKAYKTWLKDSSNTESYKRWIKSGGESYSATHDVMVDEICSLPSYKKWWGLREIYPLEKADYLKSGKIPWYISPIILKFIRSFLKGD
jgi:hypothetical protein